MSQRVRVPCAQCSAGLSLPSGRVGNVTCPKCLTKFTADTRDISENASTAAWGFAENKLKGMRQVIVALNADDSPNCSEIGSLAMLGGTNEKFLQSPCVVGVMELQTHPHPRVLVRLDTLSERLARDKLSIAFTFFETKFGGLVVLYVQAPSIDENLDSPFLECTFGLDAEITANKLLALFGGSNLTITLAEEGGMFDTVEGRFDRNFDITGGCGKKLSSEYENLLRYHQGLADVDFRETNRVVEELIPLNKSPIMDLP